MSIKKKKRCCYILTIVVIFIILYEFKNCWKVGNVFSKSYNICDIQRDHESRRKKELTEEERRKLRKAYYCEVRTLGCFPKVEASPLILSYTDTSSMTKQSCFTACSAKLQKQRIPFYAGLTRGDTCLCASTIDITLDELVHCSSKCSGDKHVTCGGENDVEWHLMQAPCLKGESLSTSASELRFLGCVADNVKQNLLSSTCVEKVVDVSRSLCMLYCGAKGSPLALVDASSTCICGRATQSLHWFSEKKSCDAKSTRIYRTFAQDERCEPLHFLPPNSTIRKAVLLSFPGSGNTWTRHLIEQASGIYTGSVYGDCDLMNSGFLGESRSISDRNTFVIKDHMLVGTTMATYHSVIFLIRDPYAAYIAEFNRHISGSRTGHANQSTFLKDFEDQFYDHTHLKTWDVLFQYVADSKKPFHLIKYEDLIRDPIKQVRKIMKFLESINGFRQKDLEKNLFCLRQNLQGSYKRTKTVVDPFTNRLKTELNSVIKNAQNILARVGCKVDFSYYKRT